MAHGSRFRPRGQGTKTRRNRQWSLGPSGTISRTASGSTIFATGSQALVELTQLRLRGFLKIYITSGAAAAEGYNGAVGIGICNENAFAAGVASVNIPVTDMGWDGWLWHSFFAVNAITGTPADGVNAATYGINMEVDSKAMRKIKTGDILYAATEVTEVGTSNLRLDLQSRVLDMAV